MPRLHRDRIKGGNVIPGGPRGESNPMKAVGTSQIKPASHASVVRLAREKNKAKAFLELRRETRRVYPQRCAFVRSRLRSKYHASALARWQESGASRDDARLENALSIAPSRGTDYKESTQTAPGTRQRIFETPNQWKPSATTARVRHGAESPAPPEVLMPATKKQLVLSGLCASRWTDRRTSGTRFQTRQTPELQPADEKLGLSRAPFRRSWSSGWFAPLRAQVRENSGVI